VDGRRGYPDDDQQRQWQDDERGFGERDWRDGGYRAPEPRDAGREREAEPSFDGFAGAYGGAEPRWGDKQADQPSWNSSAGLLPADRAQRQIDDTAQRGYAGESVRPVSAAPTRPVSAAPARPVSAQPGGGFTMPVPAPPPGLLPEGGPPPPDAVNAPTGAMPPVAPRDDAQRFHTEPIDRSALRRPAAAPTAGDGVYRTRRPAMALVYGVLTVIFEIGALRIFLDSMFTGDLVISGIVSGTFLIAGLPLLAAGLYGATTGGTRADGPGGWLRPPAVYLIAGLGLLIAAGLAAA